MRAISTACRLLLVATFTFVPLSGEPAKLLRVSIPSTAAANSPKSPLDCPPEGKGGDPDLNRQKNRVQAPAKLRDVSFDQIVKLNRIAVNKKGRQTWTDAERQQVAEVENGDRVAVVGYIFDAKYSVPETCNCSFTAEPWLDFHIWLVRDRRNADKSKSFVVEMTPRVRQQHPGWTVKKLRSLIPPRAWTMVRVGGLMTFDSEHWNFVRDGLRATVWEIHPVFQFWVCSTGTNCDPARTEGWKLLDDITEP
jgi:hypothetical protein